ncbi:MAG: glycoside hydrolase family 3 protein [Clostridia bacterium]|nr:glycoside hydrolase family 3 protein [Clostridia bacterium]
MKNTKKILAIVLAIMMTLSCFSMASFAVSGDVPADIIEMSSQVAVELEQEGIVLLKNEDNVLPLGDKKVNIFGAGSVVPFLGGAGSGAITTDDPVTFYEALDENNINYNKELRELYEAECSGNEIPKTGNTVVNNLLQLVLASSSLEEMPCDKLTDEIMQNAVEFSDTAIIVISRTSRETADLPIDVLRLLEEEQKLVEKVTSSFENVVVLFNTGNVMEMGWLEEYDSIKAAAMIWIPGEFGMRAVAQMLTGEVNPSGRLTDTAVYNVEDHPSTECFGTYEYEGGGNYVEYLEGIYVGYRYFETFAKDKVQYPFGYGLSYTTFSKEIVSYDIGEEVITANVKVTNTGNVAGKETVQIYYSAPYTKGGIEKSAICLGGYGKTDMLQPNESETVKVEVKISDMMSYDKDNLEAWILEKGDYKIILGENVREHLDSFTYTVKEDVVVKEDGVSGNEIKNLFDFAYSGFTVLSRNDVEGTCPVARQLTATEDILNPDKFPEPVTEGEAPKTGVKYEETIMLQDVYENPGLMDAFLDQLTVSEMITLVAHSGYETQGIDRLGVPKTYDNDGPSCVKGAHGQTYFDCGTAYPCATAIACTWNDDLAFEMGKSAGIEADAMDTDIWYAPGANIHRNPMGGRNFEYFSEDPLVAGRMSAGIVAGAKSEGLITTIKHFVLNEQESHRNGIFTWADEQTLREIYLKAFELPIKEGGSDGVMSAYNRLGTDWCGGCSELLNDLLRTEWGYEGYVISDYSSNMTGTGYMSPVVAVYNGNDTMLTGLWLISMPSHIIEMQKAYKNDPIGFGTALREACRNIMNVKMKTKAFLEPSEDAPYLLDLFIKPDEWEWTEPQIISTIKYVVSNVVNTVILVVRVIM